MFLLAVGFTCNSSSIAENDHHIDKKFRWSGTFSRGKREKRKTLRRGKT